MARGTAGMDGAFRRVPSMFHTLEGDLSAQMPIADAARRGRDAEIGLHGAGGYGRVE